MPTGSKRDKDNGSIRLLNPNRETLRLGALAAKIRSVLHTSDTKQMTAADPDREPGSHTSKPNYAKHAGGGRPFTEDRWEIFLHNFAKLGLLGQAARAADVAPETIRRYRRDIPEFAEMFDQALQDYRESLEREVHRRAVEGWDEPVYQKGELCGTIRRHSDRMLELLIKKNIPEYRDKVSVDANVQGGVMVVPATAQDMDAWEKQFGQKAQGKTGQEG